MPTFFFRLRDHLRSGSPAVLATIVSGQGSTPRTPGTKMAVLPGGAILSTIGGGRVEAEVMAAAPGVLAGGAARLSRFDLTGTDAADMDMICGGRLDVLLEPLAPEGADLEHLAGLAAAERAVAPLLACTVLLPAPSLGEDAYRAAHALLAPDAAADPDAAVAALPEVFRVSHGPALARALAQAGAEALLAGRCPTRVAAGEGALVVAEPVRAAGRLILFGGGHISQQLARLAEQMEFPLTVLDDRAEFACRDRFPSALEIVVPDSFADVMGGLGVGPDTFLIIVTRGHAHDMTVLEQALRTPAGYIGMIGSRRKRDAIYAALRGKGFTDADFARVHCPVGLSIGAETPAEIAVSIMAELIAARAGHSVALSPMPPVG